MSDMMYSFYMFSSFESGDCQMIYAINYYNQCSLLIEKPFYLLRPQRFFISNSVRVCTDTFIDTLSQGWGF